MKFEDIQVDATYYDGKEGVRKVLHCDRIVREVVYQILAARDEFTFDYQIARSIPAIGLSERVSLRGFAVWAKARIEDRELDALLFKLAVGKVRLTRNERAFLLPRLEDGQRFRSRRLRLDKLMPREKQAVEGLVKKKLLLMTGPVEAEFTRLGEAWLQTYPMPLNRMAVST